MIYNGNVILVRTMKHLVIGQFLVIVFVIPLDQGELNQI